MLSGPETVTKIFLKLFPRDKKLRGMKRNTIFSLPDGKFLKLVFKVQFKFLTSSWF